MNTNKERSGLIMPVGIKVAKPLKHTEFTCPYCGGIAASIIISGRISVKCYCCSFAESAKPTHRKKA